MNRNISNLCIRAQSHKPRLTLKDKVVASMRQPNPNANPLGQQGLTKKIFYYRMHDLLMKVINLVVFRAKK